MKNYVHKLIGKSEKTELYFAILCGIFLLTAFLIQKKAVLPEWIFLISYTISYVFGSYFIIIAAYQKIVKGSFDIDFLMIAAAVGAYLV